MSCFSHFSKYSASKDTLQNTKHKTNETISNYTKTDVRIPNIEFEKMKTPFSLPLSMKSRLIDEVCSR